MGTPIPPELAPENWEDAAALMAFRIDDARDRGLQHPACEEGYLSVLGAMREEYDSWLMRTYGLTDDDLDMLIVANWFTAFATLVLDAGELHEDIHVDSAESILPLMTAKQHDYGHHNIQRFGMEGILVRMHDKLARLENLEMRSYDMKSTELCEAKEDTIADLIGYCIIACMYSYGVWMLPMQLDEID